MVVLCICFTKHRIALDDVKEEKDVLIKGDEELPVQFKRLIYLYDELETVPKFDPPVTPVDAKDYVLKVQVHFFKSLIFIATSTGTSAYQD